MGKTTVTTTDALRKQIWEEELYRDIRQAPYFSEFMAKIIRLACKA